MKSRLAACMVAIVLQAAGPSTADAQERRGFWIGAGVGLGSMDISTGDGIDFGRRIRDGALDVLTGWTLNPALLIGLEINSLTANVIHDGVFQNSGVIDLAGTVTYYPRPSAGLFVKAGLGPSFFNDFEQSPALDVGGTGIGAIVGTGYDIYLGRNFSVTTAIDFRFSRIGNVTIDGQPGFRNWTHNVIDFTVGIKFN